MKLYRNIIILVVAFLVLIGAYFVVKPMLSVEEEEYKSIEVYKLDKDQAVELTVKNNEDIFAFKKNDTEWELVSGGDFDINQVQIDSIVSNMCDLYAYKLVEEKPKSLEKYGLENPVVVTVKFSDGSTAEIEVGNETPTRTGYYIREKSKDAVYTIALYAGNILKANENSIRNRFILDVTTQEVTEFAVTREGKQSFKALKSNDKGWQLVEPIEAGINMVRLNTALDALVRAEVVDYIEKDVKDLAKYGLDNPSYVVEAATESQRVTLLIGDVKENHSESYGMFKGSNEVFTLNPGSLGFLDTPALEMTDGIIYAPYIYTVNDAEINIDGKTIKLKIEEVKAETETEVDKEYKFYVDGIDVEAKKGEEAVAKFRNYYASLIGVMASAIEPEAEPAGDAEISIIYNLNTEPGKVTVEFIPRDEKTYYAMRNGQYTGIVVRKDAFDAEDGPRKVYENLMTMLQN
ncbi:DUF4340 domain-containing protein [Acetivibrio mesophilus]|nr:DUF4340 domain-containing protein [Acetivibrio mesophilus]HHV30255.1 DUF4340 domain-containing protein [Clostridium sp.]